MKKILLMFSLICLLPLASAQQLTVSVGDISGAKGGTSKVPITLAGASDIGSMDIVLKYDTDILNAISVENGELGKNSFVEANTAKGGEVVIALATSSGINGDGTAAIISFEVKGDVGSKSDLILDKVVVNDINLAEVTATAKNGMLRVTEVAPMAGGTGTAVLALAAITVAILLIRRKK
jgi:hypothetical protein